MGHRKAEGRKEGIKKERRGKKGEGERMMQQKIKEREIEQ